MPILRFSVMSPTKGYSRPDIEVGEDTTWVDAAEKLVKRGFFPKVSDVAFYDDRNGYRINMPSGIILDYWIRTRDDSHDFYLKAMARKPISPDATGSAAAAYNEPTTEDGSSGGISESGGSSGASATKPAEDEPRVFYGPHPPIFGAPFSHLFF
jgi:hypothetical protein